MSFYNSRGSTCVDSGSSETALSRGTLIASDLIPRNSNGEKEVRDGGNALDVVDDSNASHSKLDVENAQEPRESGSYDGSRA